MDLSQYNINIFGPVTCVPDGYGDMARSILKSCDINNFHVSAKPITYGRSSGLSMIDSKYIDRAISREPDPSKKNINIYCMTPAPVAAKREDINILYSMWETSLIPLQWVSIINDYYDYIIVPEINSVEAFSLSGVTKPIYILPIYQNAMQIHNAHELPSLTEALGGRYSFYSIFQWGFRKNPEALIKAYTMEFDAEFDDVILVLKTHINDATRKEDITGIIATIQYECGRKDGTKLPEIICITEQAPAAKIASLHKSCDAYVCTSRGEGWCMPAIDASFAGNHIIFTSGLPLDYTLREYKNKKSVKSYIDYMAGSDSPLYDSTQTCFDIDVKELRAAMREAYNNKKSKTEADAVVAIATYDVQNYSNELIEILNKMLGEEK